MGLDQAHSQTLFSLNDWSFEESLVALEDHAIFDFAVLVEIEPSAIRTFASLIAIIEHPFSLFISDGRLHLRQKLIFYLDVATGRPSYHNLLILIRAATKGILSKKLLNLQHIRLVSFDYRENLKSQLEGRWSVIRGWLNQVRHYIWFSHVQEKVVSKDEWSRQLNESTITDPQILDFVSHWFKIEADLELSSSVLFLLFFILGGNHKVIYDFLLIDR